MTKRKNYDALLKMTAVGSSVGSDSGGADADANAIANAFIVPLQLQTPSKSKPPNRKKKPKTMKVETEVEEILLVGNDDVSGRVKNEVSVTEKDGTMVKVQTKKKKLRRVDFDAEDDYALLGTSIHDTNNSKNSTNHHNTSAAVTTGNTSTANVITKTAKIKKTAGASATKIFEDVRPTAIRLTEHGGYLHTKQSRMKISQANQGKAPWNKGKERTLTAKAKISAGVRARNDELLQQKLKVLNITEEVWYQKKRQIKLLRERVRKAKVAAKNYIEEQKQLREQSECRDSVKEEQERGNDPELHAYFLEEDVDVSGRKNDNDLLPFMEVDTNPNVRIVEEPTDVVTRIDEETAISQESLPQSEPNRNENDPRTSSAFCNIPMFQRDIEWTPHPFDDQGTRYDTLCPNDGPGGLICCPYCLETYTKYMTATIQDIQRHTTMKIGHEVEELYHFVRDTKQQLVQTMKVTRRKPIPIRQYSLHSTTKPVAATTTTTATSNSNGTTDTATATATNHSRTKKLKNTDDPKTSAISQKKKTSKVPPSKKNPSVVTTVSTTNSIRNTIPVPDPEHVPLGVVDQQTEPVSEELTEFISPNELLHTDPQLLLDYDDINASEVYEI